MKGNRITIEVHDDQSISTQTTGDFTTEAVLHILATVQLGAMQHLVDRAPQEQKQQVAEHLYDSYNYLVSSVLDSFIPERELHPDLTAEAMLHAENAFLENEVGKQPTPVNLTEV